MATVQTPVHRSGQRYRVQRSATFPPERTSRTRNLPSTSPLKMITFSLVILTAAFGGRLDHLVSTAAVVANASIPCGITQTSASLLSHEAESLTVTCKNAPCAISSPPLYREVPRRRPQVIAGADGRTYYKPRHFYRQQRTCERFENIYRLLRAAFSGSISATKNSNKGSVLIS